ncbi:MAG: ribosome-associated translation inhibitor RaiA [Planctomycetota bacterium]
MDTMITGRHFEITEAIHAHAQDKMAKLPRYYDRLTKVELIVEKSDDHTYRVEGICHIDGMDHMVATASDGDVYHCFELLAKKLERQLTDAKEKIRNHKHSPLN